MHPRWFRSRLFTFGLAGLLILLTAWAVYPRSSLLLIHQGKTGITHAFIKSPDATGVRRIDNRRPGSINRNRPVLPMGTILKSPGLSRLGWRTAVHRHAEGDRYRTHYFSSPPWEISADYGWGQSFLIANWAILSAYLITWTSALILWQRRKHRLMNPHAPAAN